MSNVATNSYQVRTAICRNNCLILAITTLLGCSVEKNTPPSLDGSSADPNLPRQGPDPATSSSTTTDTNQIHTDLSTISPDASPLDTPSTDLPDISPHQPIDSSFDLSNTLNKFDSPPDTLADHLPNLTLDLLPNTSSDLKKDIPSPDLTPNLPQGTTCSHNSDCRSSFCTDGVCCNVAKCTDPCTPGSSACTPYNSFTCAPYGTCRGF